VTILFPVQVQEPEDELQVSLQLPQIREELHRLDIIHSRQLIRQPGKLFRISPARSIVQLLPHPDLLQAQNRNITALTDLIPQVIIIQG
jgi:hypothetical protein